jgi:hypothetical protein
MKAIPYKNQEEMICFPYTSAILIIVKGVLSFPYVTFRA